MKRRDFIVASGSTVLSGLATSQIQRPAIGLDFEISTPDKDPSEVDSLVIEFETLEITPKYLDENETVNVQAKVEVANQTKRSNELQTSVINGRTKNLENSIDSIVVDGLNTSSSISGDVTVSIDHPDIQDSYSQQFYVNGSGILESVVEDFDDQSYSGWTGDTSNWGFTQNPAISGYASTFDGNGANAIYSDSLSNLPTRGDKIQYYTRLSTTDDRTMFYFFLETTGDESEDGYGVFVDSRADNFTLYRFDSGSLTTLDGVSQTPQTDVWYQVLIDDSQSPIVVKIYNNNTQSLVATLSPSSEDNTYSGTDIGLKAVENEFGAGIQYFDEIT
jgi:hypothetical protein